MTDIHARLGELTPAQRKLLALKLKQKAAAAGDAPAGGEGPREYPASFAQRRLWLLDRLQPGSHSYNIPGGWRFRGPLDVDALSRTLDELARRHESLRTRLETRGDEPMQVVLPPLPIPLPLVDLSSRPADEREPELERLGREHAERPFRLDEAPLLRASLVRMADDDHALLWTIHHAVSDGWSSGVIARELGALYVAFAAGHPSPLPAPGLSYGEYAARQRERLSGAALARLTEFWRGALAGAPARLELPTDFPRPAARSPRGGMVEAALDANVPARVEALARAEGATPFMVYLAAFQLLLGRWARQRDVLVGAAIANRTSPEVEDTVGFFVNTLVLRGDLGGEPSFRALLGRVRDATLAAYDHQELPFEKLVEEINPERSLSYAPLVQALFVLHNQGAPVASAPSSPSADADGGGLRVASLGHDASSTRFDLSLSVVERGDGAEAWLTYASDLWERATVQRMLARYAALLAAALADPDAPAWALPLFIAGERERVVGEWAGRPHPFPRGIPLPARLAARARETPDAVAVESPDGSLTFAELDAAAGRLARWLIARGAGPERRVGVCLGHTSELVVALLAVLKSGGAFVPLDPAHPRERLAGLMDDAGVSIVLTRSDLLDRLPEDARVVAVDSIQAGVSALSPLDREMEIDPSHLAYVIYTSGSTGRPKGVMVEHGSLAAYLDWVDGELFGDSVEAVPMVTRPGFDAVLKQLFSPLLRGRAVWIPGEETAADPAALMAALSGRRAAALNCVPALWSALLDAADQGARAPLPAPHALVALWLGGERLDAALVARTRARLPHLRIVNLYGPTEATANAVFADAGPGALVPIGLPVEGDSAYVVDEALRLLPGDLPGELVIGGAGVARGYLDAPALTAERFVPDPFSAIPGARLYRTGDRARRWADGRLEYLGRLDAQVKVRGVRIEPGEVEAALLALPGVRDAAVAAVDGGPSGARLAAWVVARADATPEALRAALASRLPEAMVPTAFVLLDTLPRMPNGKVDRRALPAPDLAPGEGGYVEPRTETERRMAAIWSAVIGVERVGARDDFFLLGGHSLLATQVISRVREGFAAELPLRALFEAPRLDHFAAMVDAAAGAEVEADTPVTARGGNDLPLSFAQERLWFVDRMDPGSTAYNLPMPLRLDGPLDVRALERALGEVVRRHAVLRTRFALVDGVPVQRIDPADDFHLPVEDVPGLSEDEREVQLHAFAADEGRTPFDLEAGPLFRARLLRAGPDDHLLLLGMHHAVSDGWSAGIFWRELTTLYGAFSRGEASPLPELPVRYADFAAWQREWLRGERLVAQVAWWREHLAGAPAVLTLPTDRPRPPVRSNRGARIGFSLPADAAGAMRALALEQRATPFMGLLAAFSLVLARWSGQDDVVVGTPVAGRTRRETEGLIGLFVNTLPIRTELAGDPSFRALLGHVREATLGAYSHQDIPFERLVEELAPERSLSHAPVFQVMLALQNDPEGPSEGFAGLDARWLVGDGGTAKAELSLVLAETPDGRIGGAMEYATDLFDAATAHRLAEHLVTLVRAAVAAPDAPGSTLALIGDEERDALVAAGSATASFPVTQSLPTRFAEQVARTPGAIALTFGGERVTYAQLSGRANHLAHRLIELGARPDSLVGLFVERSVETVVGILAILKAGAGYLPLDPAYPEDRLAYMLEDSGAPIVITTAELAERLPADGPTLIRLDADADRIAAQPGDDPAIDISADSLAYVIYTSGSTGKPKGVQVTHANVARLFGATDEWFGFGAEDVWTLFHSCAFDFSVWEIWGALLYGGRLVIVPFDVSRSPEEFYGLLAAERVTVLNQTPSAFRQLMRADEDAAGRGEMRDLALRAVIFGGEALDPASLRGWVERRGDDSPRLINMYGITETTVHVTYRVIRAMDTVDGSPSPIGIPIPDLAVHLLDRAGRLVPTGIVGEMYVGGGGVARGYLHRPELTAQRFVPDPFVADSDARLYRSGDLARRLPDGSLEFQGRADDQVKVRGFRIELGEIESVLLAHPSVREAVVLARGDDEARRLVAWIVGDAIGAAELRAHLGAHLPDYMVPSAFVFLDALPLTRHGKVDRRALPEPDATGLAGAGYVAPRTPTEELLASVWAELLGAARVGVDDGFFELGGHSLLATRVASRVRETLGVELPVRAVFEHPTLGALAAEVDRLRRTAQGVEAPPIRPVPRGDGDLPLSFAQERLWFVDRMEAGSATYHMPLFARLEGELDEDALRRALDELVRRHESLRTHFPLVDGLPVQRIAPPAPVELFTHDYGALRDDEREDEAQRLVREHARIPFTLETGPLFRADLARLGERDHLLLLTLHHVIADGWSLDLLWRELAALYGAFSRGEPSPLPEAAVQYGDFAAWQRSWLTGDVLARQLAYWKRTLDGAPPLLRLPSDRPRPEVQTHTAAVEAALLPRAQADAVLALARRQGATLFMVLLAGLDVVLSRLSGDGDVVVGTPIAGRTRAETEGVVGLFLNSLALRVDLSGDPAFGELLARVREATLGAYAHQDVPFEAVLEEVHPERTLDRTPIFQVMLNLANFAPGAAGVAADLPGLVAHEVDRGAPVASKFDLTLYAGETAAGLALHLVYNPDLFDAARMRALLAQVGGVLEQAAADPARPLSALSLAVENGAAPPSADRAVRTGTGAPAGIGELGEMWTRQADGEWRSTGQRARPRPDGVVELAVDEEATAPASASAVAPTPSVDGDTGEEPTETERVVLEIWRDVLDVPVVRLRDDFFDLGGHSLLGVRLLAMVKKRLGVTLPLTALFAHPTPAGLAAAVENAGKARDFHHVIPLGDPAVATLPPLFCMHAAGGTVFRYRDLAARLGPARMVYALQAGGVSDGREPLRSVDLMAERYLEEVRRVQPHGPYHLAGWSAGGVTAVEMAHRLLAAGEEVAFLGLLDSSPPNAEAEIPDPVQMYLRLAAGLTGAEGPVLDALGDELVELPIGERLEHLAGWLARNGSESRIGELDGLRPVVEVFRANVTASRRHVLAPYPGELTLFCAEWGRGGGWEAVALPDLWRPYVAGRLRVEVVPGTHVNMIGVPYVDILAEVIEEVIAAGTA